MKSLLMVMAAFLAVALLCASPAAAADSWFLAPLKGSAQPMALEEATPARKMPNIVRPVKFQDTVRAESRVLREAPPAPLVTEVDEVTSEEAIAATQNSRNQNLGCGAGGGGCGGGGGGRGLFGRR